jgi:hypothetical protein
MFIFHVVVFISPSTSSTSICTRPKSKLYNSLHYFDVATVLWSSASNKIFCMLRYLKASYFVHTGPYWSMLRYLKASYFVHTGPYWSMLRYLKASYFVHTGPYWSMLRAKFIPCTLSHLISYRFPPIYTKSSFRCSDQHFVQCIAQTAKSDIHSSHFYYNMRQLQAHITFVLPQLHIHYFLTCCSCQAV